MTEIIGDNRADIAVETFQPEVFAFDPIKRLDKSEGISDFSDSMRFALNPRCFNKWLQLTKSFAAPYGSAIGTSTVGFIDKNPETSGDVLDVFHNASMKLIDEADDRAVARLLRGSARQVLKESSLAISSLGVTLRKRHN